MRIGLQIERKKQNSKYHHACRRQEFQINDKSQKQKLSSFIIKYQQVLVNEYCYLKIICHLVFVICDFTGFNYEIKIYT